MYKKKIEIMNVHIWEKLLSYVYRKSEKT